MHTINEIQSMSQEELLKTLNEAKRALSELRVRNGVNQLKETHKIRDTRREVARLKMFLAKK